jgi:hypothetical protein
LMIENVRVTAMGKSFYVWASRPNSVARGT